MLYQLYICAADAAAPVARLDRLRALKEKQERRKQALEGVGEYHADWHDDAKGQITQHSREIGDTLAASKGVADALDELERLSTQNLEVVGRIVRDFSGSMIHQLTQFKDLVEGPAQAQVEEMIAQVRRDEQIAQARIDALK